MGYQQDDTDTDMIFLPVQPEELGLKQIGRVRIGFSTVEITDITKNKSLTINKFYDAWMRINKNGGLL